MRNCIDVPLASLLVATTLGLAACSESKAPASAGAPAQQAAAPAEPKTPELDELGQPADPRFIGKVWVSTTPGHARGTVMIFLPDRTLMMDSCFETYRLSKWGAQGDRIRWIEEAIPIEATLSMPSDHELRLQVAGQDNVQSFVTATVPYVCPDMPR